jgi:4'-phosphopantetheinyl transferase
MIFSIEPDSLDLFWIPLDHPAHSVEETLPLLTNEERERAGRFYFVEDRRRWTLCRGILKTLLGLYLQREPAAIELSYGANGKPMIGGANGNGGLCFNLSHSAERMLLGLSTTPHIGVDTEFIKPVRDFTDLAKRFFAEVEYDRILQSLPDERLKNFYRTWTKKEAFLKATGDGLSRNLNEFAVAIGKDGNSVSMGEGSLSGWFLEEVRTEPDYIASFCLSERPRRIRLYLYTPESVTELESVKG